MKVLVLGAGAMGSYYGSRLIQAGAQVTFLVRERRAEVLRREGLRVTSELGDFAGPVDLVEAGSKLPEQDVVLLACKAYDLQGAIDSIASAVGPNTALLPVLNGLESYDRLDERFGRDRVLGAVAYVAVQLAEDGSTRHMGPADRFVVGARSPTQTTLAAEIHSVLSQTPGQRTLSHRIEQDLWNKWVMLSAGASVTCLMRANIAQILRTSDGRAVIESALGECLEVARLEGFALGEQEQQPLRGLLLNPESGWMASMARDIEQHRTRLEADSIVGDMVARGRRHGLPMPTLRAAYAHLQAYLLRRGADGLA